MSAAPAARWYTPTASASSDAAVLSNATSLGDAPLEVVVGSVVVFAFLILVATTTRRRRRRLAFDDDPDGGGGSGSLE